MAGGRALPPHPGPDDPLRFVPWRWIPHPHPLVSFVTALPPLRVALVLLVILTAGTACHRNTLTDPGAPPPGATLYKQPPLSTDRVWLAELAGTTPSDTTVTFPADSGRTIVMRHGPPDNAIFAIVQFAPGALKPPSGAQAEVVLHPVPGRLGVEVLSPDTFAAGATVTLSYAIHFQAPSDAVAKFAGVGRFEQALAAAKTLPDGRLQFLRTERPAADMARFTIDGSATYLLATPR